MLRPDRRELTRFQLIPGERFVSKIGAIGILNGFFHFLAGAWHLRVEQFPERHVLDLPATVEESYHVTFAESFKEQAGLNRPLNPATAEAIGRNAFEFEDIRSLLIHSRVPGAQVVVGHGRRDATMLARKLFRIDIFVFQHRRHAGGISDQGDRHLLSINAIDDGGQAAHLEKRDVFFSQRLGRARVRVDRIKFLDRRDLIEGAHCILIDGESQMRSKGNVAQVSFGMEKMHSAVGQELEIDQFTRAVGFELAGAMNVIRRHQFAADVVLGTDWRKFAVPELIPG